MTGRYIQMAPMDEQAAADLFAFFYSIRRFFEKPGDATRGKRLFTSLSCSRCHGITESNVMAAKSVVLWTSPAYLIAMIEVMWNHGANMHDAMAHRRSACHRLSGFYVSDVLAYIRSLAPAAKNTGVFQTTSGANAQSLFMEKSCVVCHTLADQFLSKNLRGQTLTDFAAAMRNHGPIMRSAPLRLDPDEMREIVSFVWAQRYLEDKGNLERGKEVSSRRESAAFATKARPAAGFPRWRHAKGISPYITSCLSRGHGPAMRAACANGISHGPNSTHAKCPISLLIWT